MEKEKTLNAKIKYTYLAPDAFGSNLSYEIGFVTSEGEFSTGKVYGTSEAIGLALAALELQRWEDLPRKYARIKVANGKVIAFGNLLDDRWVSINDNR